MSDDIILRSRLRVLSHNLEEVKNVIAAVESVREGLQRVILTWETDESGRVKLQRTLTELHDKASSVRGDLRVGTTEASNLDAVIKGMQNLQDQLCSDEIISAVEAIRARSMDLRQTELRSTIGDFLVRNADQQCRAITRIEAALDAESTSPDEKVRGQAAHRAWATYLEVLPKAQDVFAEYVDFLGGLALRDAGYDGGICRIADELVHAFGQLRDISWNSLTIPARRDALDMTMARIIRIGFPEWTLWALPLVAYGFGSVLVGNVRSFTDFTDRVPEPRRACVRVLLADAFATYVMGPAYACALMLLRLDPMAQEEPDEDGLTLMRAEVVLAMLRRMSKEANDHPYDRVHAWLRDHWVSAVAQTRTSPEHVPAAIDPEVLVYFVADELWGKELNPRAWPKIDKWSQAMCEEQVLRAENVDRIEDSLGYVLNAAWLARLRPDVESDDAEYGGAEAVDLADLARTARMYWRVIDDTQRRAANQASGGQFVPAHKGGDRR